MSAATFAAVFAAVCFAVLWWHEYRARQFQRRLWIERLRDSVADTKSANDNAERLLAERDQLRSEVERLTRFAEQKVAERDRADDRAETLRAEVERLKDQGRTACELFDHLKDAQRELGAEQEAHDKTKTRLELAMRWHLVALRLLVHARRFTLTPPTQPEVNSWLREVDAHFADVKERHPQDENRPGSETQSGTESVPAAEKGGG